MEGSQEKDIEILCYGLRRSRNLKILFSLIAFLLGITITFIFPRWLDTEGLGFPIFGGILLILGVSRLFLTLLHFDVEQDELVKLLRGDREKIVWVYYLKTENMPFGIKMFNICTLFVAFRDGEQQALILPKARILVLMQELRTRLPNATFGHSMEKEQLFRANPLLLVRNNFDRDFNN